MVSAPLPAIAELKESDSKSRLRLWIRLLRASRLIESVARERLKSQFNATLPRFDVMAALYRKPDGMLMSEISRFLMVSAALARCLYWMLGVGCSMLDVFLRLPRGHQPEGLQESKPPLSKTR